MEYSLITRSLAYRPIWLRCSFDRAITCNKASAKALEFFLGTITPVPPNIIPASPTSVLIQGKPIAIASLNALGKPSIQEGKQKISIADKQTATSLRCPSKTKRSLCPVL